MLKRKFRSLSRLLLLSAAALASANCSESKVESGVESGLDTRRSPERPDLVIVTIDTLRADHLGMYGYFRNTSPVLDALAKESIVFDHCISPMATTLPTHTSLFTGTWPIEHGVLANMTGDGKRFQRSSKLTTFAEYVREIGYSTQALVSGRPLRPKFGLGDGFDGYGEPELDERSAEETTNLAIRWLKLQQAAQQTSPKRKPFFLWIHYFDPHSSYAPPAPFDNVFQNSADLSQYIADREFQTETERHGGFINEVHSGINGYDGEILYTDTQLGRLFDALREVGRWNETVVAVISDHGEGLNQHAEPGHGLIWDEQLRVPFLIRDPQSDPRRVPSVISVVDAIPTLIGLLQLPDAEAFLEQMSGADALSSDFRERAVFSSISGRRLSEGFELEMSLTAKDWKYRRLADGAEKLYDRVGDPFELNDVGALHPKIVAELRDELFAVHASQSRKGRELGGGSTVPLTDDEVKELEALGYGGFD